MKTVTFGKGEIAIFDIQETVDNGRRGIVLRKMKKPGIINHHMKKPGMYDGDAYKFNNNTDVILWFENMEGLRILQDRISIMALKMQDYTITDVVK